MSFLSSIGVKNFRNFIEYTHLEFSIINAITGVNNSGKSSIFKLLLLIKDNFVKDKFIHSLNFTGEDHNLAFFENVTNTQDDSLVLSITLPFQIFNSQDYLIQLSYSVPKKGKSYVATCNEIIIYRLTLKEKLLSITRKPFVDNATSYSESIQDHYTLDFDLELFTKALKEFKKYKREQAKAFKQMFSSNYQDLDYHSPQEDLRHQIYEDFEIRAVNGWIDLPNLPSGNLNFYDKSNSIIDVINEFLKIKGRKVKEVYFLTGADIQYDYGLNFKTEDLGLLENAIKHLRFEKEIKEQNSNSKIDRHSVVLSSLVKVIVESGFERLREIFTEGISYLPLQVTNNDRLHVIKGNIFNTTINQLYQYYSLHHYDLTKVYIEDWIKRFEIDNFNTFKINSYPELNICTFELLEKSNPKNKRVLADLGLGTAQVMLILFKIAVESCKNSYVDEYNSEIEYRNHIIFIEEPEAHLHPKWQSILADLIIDASDRFKTQFIIDTHSEYFIRRLQFHIANKTISSSNLKIYQIRKDSNCSAIVKPMTIDYNGNFKMEFSEGFFDESTTLFDELNLRQEINNLEIRIRENEIDIKCIFLTEDSNAVKNNNQALNFISKANGFPEDQIKILSYKSSSELNFCLGMAKAIEEIPSIQLVVWHLDCDGEPDKRLNMLNGLINSASLKKTKPFITKFNDIEGYFVNLEHIKFLFPQINKSEIIKMVKKAESLVKEKTISNLSQRFGGNIAPAKNEYERDPVLYRHTKKMIPFINNEIRAITKSKSNTIIAYSSHLLDDTLLSYSKLI